MRTGQEKRLSVKIFFTWHLVQAGEKDIGQKIGVGYIRILCPTRNRAISISSYLFFLSEVVQQRGSFFNSEEFIIVYLIFPE